MAKFKLKSSQFRKERQNSWRELDRILDLVQKKGALSLSPAELHRLPTLYRSAVSSLSVARAISLDRNLLEYLEALVCRAFVLVYSSKRPARDLVADFLTIEFPGAVYRLRWLFTASMILMLLGFACGFSLTSHDPERFYSLVPQEMAEGRNPAASTQELKAILFGSSLGDPPRSGLRRGLTLFASFLFTHNAKIGILCFSLGFVAGIPVVGLLFYNGILLGAMTALYASRGLGSDFLAWVLGHGVTELTAVGLCGAAGLAVAGKILFPGRHTRAVNLALEGRAVAPVVIGSVLMFLMAACLESYFRQLVAVTWLRWAVAAGTGILWSAYFIGRGRPTAVRSAAASAPFWR